jgi:quinol monooxygenase YgiN
MSELFVIARFVARTGKHDQLRSLLAAMLSPTRAEPGCNSYDLYESDAKGRFYLYESWQSQAALDQDKATAHFKRLLEAGKHLVSEPFEVNILTSILPGNAQQ